MNKRKRMVARLFHIQKKQQMKKVLLICTVLFACAFSAGAQENSVEIDGIRYELTTFADGTGMAQVESSDAYAGEITIPHDVEWDGRIYEVGLGVATFLENQNITGVRIGARFVPMMAFKGCTALKSVKFLPGVEEISSYAFSGCTALASVEFSETITAVQEDVFSFCSSLERVSLPASLTRLGGSLFYGCTSLTQVDLPENLTSVSDQLFAGCTSLKEIQLPQAVTSIESLAFSRCFGLVKITMGSAVESLGNGVFDDCDNLKEIYLGTPVPPAAYFDSPDALTVFANATLYVPEGSKAAYAAAGTWRKFATIKEWDAKATGIGTVTLPAGSTASPSTYTLDGRRVEGRVPAGVYIRDGKKVMLK